MPIEYYFFCFFVSFYWQEGRAYTFSLSVQWLPYHLDHEHINLSLVN